MILRKPYKILIKNFKLIHLIMTIMMVYVVYKYGYILSFFNTATSNYTGIIRTDATGSLFNVFLYVIPLLTIILCLIIIALLYFKRKPLRLYIINIVVCIGIMILFAYSYSVVSDMELKILDAKIIRNVRDIMALGSIIQIIMIILFTVRTLGFDIKKFDFKSDLKEFDINEDDNEEFEFQVNVDTNKIHRGLNKNKRYFNYFYKENRFMIFIISLISLALVSVVIYLNLGVYNKKYTQTDYFKSSEFTMSIDSAYITNKDYRGNTISDKKSLIVLEFNIKTNYSKELQLNLARTELVVGKNKYYHTSYYKDKLADLGNSYVDELISNTFTKYLLVYEIPNELLSEEIEFRYVDKTADLTKLNAKTINVEIITKKIDELEKTIEYNLGDTIDFSGSILNRSNFTINSFEISDYFKLNYDIINNSNTYNFVEYVKPDLINNYDKTLLKINSFINMDEEIATSKTTNVFKFLSIFGTFNYEIYDTEKTDFTTLKEVKSLRIKNENIYYLEILKEIKEATKLDLVLNVRNYKYIYHIK